MSLSAVSRAACAAPRSAPGRRLERPGAWSGGDGGGRSRRWTRLLDLCMSSGPVLPASAQARRRALGRLARSRPPIPRRCRGRLEPDPSREGFDARNRHHRPDRGHEAPFLGVALVVHAVVWGRTIASSALTDKASARAPSPASVAGGGSAAISFATRQQWCVTAVKARSPGNTGRTPRAGAPAGQANACRRAGSMATWGSVRRPAGAPRRSRPRPTAPTGTGHRTA